jgi:hypothetical protein
MPSRSVSLYVRVFRPTDPLGFNWGRSQSVVEGGTAGDGLVALNEFAPLDYR